MSNVIVVDTDIGKNAAVPTEVVVASTPALVRQVATSRNAVWVVSRTKDLNLLWHAVMSGLKGEHKLIVTSRVGEGRSSMYRSVFRWVVDEGPAVHLLPRDELLEVLVSPSRDDLFVGLVIDRQDKSLVLYRGSMKPLVVPVKFFSNDAEALLSSGGFEVVDFGQAVRYGDREASADAILYAYDAAYRRRQKANRVQQDKSFGGALRRLRLMRGLSRSDFEGLSPKEVARIERGEVSKPHSRTLQLLARALEVESDEIATY